MTKTLEDWFAPVLEWLDAGAPHKENDGFGFNMNFYNSEDRPDYNDRQCGTAMCIGGAIGQFHHLDTLNIPLLDEYDEVRDIRTIIGMPKQKARELFYAATNDTDKVGSMVGLGGNFAEIDPAWAARVIRNYLVTGIVDWRGQKDAV